MEFQRWWVLKSKIFAQESTRSKEKEFKNSADELWFIKKYQNRTLKVDFLCLKLSESFQIKFSLKNINLGHQLLLKPFFDKIQF